MGEKISVWNQAVENECKLIILKKNKFLITTYHNRFTISLLLLQKTDKISKLKNL